MQRQKQLYRQNKYGNKKVVLDGHRFDSKKEAHYYAELKLRKMAGEVTAIELQPTFELQPTYKKNGKTIRAIKYVADFRVTYSDGRVEIVDVKGKKTKEYLLKKKLFEYKFPELKIIEV
ncbi:DUF1064 domain-containing protein [Bacillus sp. FJAT-45350]|uniref:DUF1064 domain-containing protein n=1 Tax=Bacillus sp. FJAT-45350 TaxID=2011014 RepID=UPI000BB69186|nr:DUF1064 domain-containing protein [Bacillus sp. FJAT-45350]